MTSLTAGFDVSVPAALASLSHSLQESDSQLAISPVVSMSMSNKNFNTQEEFYNNCDERNRQQQFQLEEDEQEQKLNTVRVKNYENLNWSLNSSLDDSTNCNKSGKGN